jgi:hypothetical protein
VIAAHEMSPGMWVQLGEGLARVAAVFPHEEPPAFAAQLRGGGVVRRPMAAVHGLAVPVEAAVWQREAGWA